MNHNNVNVGNEYVWRPASGQTLHVSVTEAPYMVLKGVNPGEEVWFCKGKVLNPPRALPDLIIDVSELHEK